MLSKSELLMPRYKVVADYPGNDLEIGTIIQFVKEGGQIIHKVYTDDGCRWEYENRYKQYPHLFQPLPWYSERKEEDLPEYVNARKLVFRHEYKTDEYGRVFCNQWLGDERDIKNSTDWFEITGNVLEGVEPATVEEYNNYTLKHFQNDTTDNI